jgi:hypothetical protein
MMAICTECSCETPSQFAQDVAAAVAELVDPYIDEISSKATSAAAELNREIQWRKNARAEVANRVYNGLVKVESAVWAAKVGSVAGLAGVELEPIRQVIDDLKAELHKACVDIGPDWWKA